MAEQTLPEQEQPRQPGLEAAMTPEPDYMPRFAGAGRLAGRTVFITGGDSGIGRATAILCAREGANVAIHYKDEREDAEKTLDLMRAEGADCIALHGDIGDKAEAERAVTAVIERFGAVNVLINNAAEQHMQTDFTKIGDDQLKRTFATNIFAQFYTIQAVLPQMRRGDAIVNLASVTAFRGNDVLIDYASTKGAILALTRALSSTLADKGIRVNAVAPGPVWTPLIPASFPAEKVAGFGGGAPLGRPGQPNEIAACIVFAACDDASYMTGQTLHPNGGDLIGS